MAGAIISDGFTFTNIEIVAQALQTFVARIIKY